MRPSWEDVWMAVAHNIGTRSRCSLRKVGAVLVSPDNSYSCVGYNGPAATFPIAADTDCQDWCPRARDGLQTRSYGNCVSVHAEANALARAERTRIIGGTLYCTSSLCWECAKLIANSGVTRVVSMVDWHRDRHRNPKASFDHLFRCGIEVFTYDQSELSPPTGTVDLSDSKEDGS